MTMSIADGREIAKLIKEYDELTSLLENQDDDDAAHDRVNRLSNHLHDCIFEGYDAPLDDSLSGAIDEAMAEFSDEGIWDAIRTRRDTVAALLVVRGVELPQEAIPEREAVASAAAVLSAGPATADDIAAADTIAAE